MSLFYSYHGRNINNQTLCSSWWSTHHHLRINLVKINKPYSDEGSRSNYQFTENKNQNMENDNTRVQSGSFIGQIPNLLTTKNQQGEKGWDIYR